MMVQRRAIAVLLLLVTVPTPACSQCTTCNQQPSQIYYNSQVAVQPANNGRPAGQFQPPSSVSRNQQIYVWYGNPQPVQNQNNGVQPQYNPNGYNNNNQQPVMYNNINRDQPNYANQPQPYNPNVPQQTPRPNQSIPGFLPPAGVPSTAFPYSTTTPAYNTVGPLAPINQVFDQPPTYLNTGSTSAPAPYYGSTTASPVYSPSTTAFPYSTQFNQGTPMPTGTASPYYSSTMSPSTTPFYPSTTTMAPATSTFPPTTTSAPMYTGSPSTVQPQFTNTMQPSQQLQQQPYVQQQQQQQPSTFAPYSSTQGPTTTAPVQIGYNPAGQPVYGQPTSTQAPFVSTTPTTPYAQSTTPYGSQYPMTGTPVNQGAIGVINMNNAPGSTPYYPSTTPSPQQPFYSPSTTQQPFVQGPTTTAPGVYQIGQGVPGVPNTANPQFNPPQNVQSSTYSPYAAGGSTLGTQQMYDPSTGLVTANGMNTMYGRYTTMEPGSQMMRDVPINGGATLSLAAGMAALLFLF